MRDDNARSPSRHLGFEDAFRIVAKANFNPFQPRDERGRWSDTADRSGLSSQVPVAYPGTYHDIVVDDFLAGLERDGSTVLKNIRILGVNGVIAIPDGASKPKGDIKPYFLEMKTGNDPEFTDDQKSVYRLICLGGHATSLDPRVSQLGLIPGALFPPLRVLLVATSGPGSPFGFVDYCKAIGLEVP